MSSLMQCSSLPGTGLGNSLVSTLIQTLLTMQCTLVPPDSWPSNTHPFHNGSNFDFVVVGAGAAGSVVASRLCENPKWNVLVLEAGGDPPLESEIPALFFPLQRTNYTWDYFTEPNGKSCLAYKDEVCYWPRGKMIGGTGGINGMLYARGNREDYDNWKRLGNPTWGWDDVLPVFEKSVLRCNDSEIGVTLSEFEVQYPEIREMLFAGAQSLGVPVRSQADLGYMNLQGTLKDGRRISTGKGYLAKSMDRPNLHVMKNARVTRINFDKSGRQAKGVTFIHNNRELVANVEKEVILSAGAIESPKLLMLSGVGPKEHLHSELNIPVVNDLRVGDNLRDHLIVPVLFEISHSVLPPDTPKGQLQAVFDYLIDQTGTLAGTGVTSVVGFINSVEGSASPYPDFINYHVFLQSGTPNADIWIKAIGLSDPAAESIRKANANSHILVVYVCLLKPKFVGAIRLRSTDPMDPPKIFADYLKEEDDIKGLLRGIHFQMKMSKTPAFQKNGAKILQLKFSKCQKFAFPSDDYWRCYMRYMVTTSFHLAGSVKMGPDTDPDAVLDWRLCVKGVSGLRVADASIMPDYISVNPYAPIVMIAEKAAEFIHEDWKKANTSSEENSMKSSTEEAIEYFSTQEASEHFCRSKKSQGMIERPSDFCVN